MTARFDEERALFEEMLPHWLPNRAGHWVLIRGRKLFGLFPTEAGAIEGGYELFGNTGFLVRQIRAKPEVAFMPYTDIEIAFTPRTPSAPTPQKFGRPTRRRPMWPDLRAHGGASAFVTRGREPRDWVAMGRACMFSA